MNDNEIETIIFMKKRMANAPIETHSSEYVKVYRELESLCKKYCRHVCETDTFDISPDYSKTITYCLFCECTFP